MKTPNADLMKQARESLTGKWGVAVGATLIYMVIAGAISSIPKAGGVISLLIAGPLCLGLAIFILAIGRNQNPKIEQIFEGFKRFSVSLSTYLLMLIFIILWSLLLIIPGIIAGLSYGMTFYILADDSAVGAREAISRSKKMMDGNKWKLFCLHCRFIGWALLCLLTIGIGFLWLVPYIQVSQAKFYEDIKTVEEKTPVVS